jgi:GntR family transcriptional regulator
VNLLDISPVDSGAPQSSALQAYRILERVVENRAWPPGSKLPAERELAQQLGVSRSTLRHVLAALADSELVEASPQRGWFVAEGPMSDPPNVLVSFTESARLRGIRAGAIALSKTVRPITLAEQEEFRAAPGAEILELERLRTLDDTPVCLDVSRILMRRVPGIETADFEDSSLYEAMLTIGGVQPVRSDYAVHAEAADSTTAGLLQIAVGSPVLVGRELTYSANGDRLLAADLTYRGDAYTFRATLYDR